MRRRARLNPMATTTASAACAILAFASLGACRDDARFQDSVPHEINVGGESLIDGAVSTQVHFDSAPTETLAWENRGPGPGARSGHALAYDAKRGKTVLFGGLSATSPLNETWEWNGTAWTAVCLDAACAASRPPARFAHAMVYDAARGVTVLFGGQGQNSALRDTWQWDGKSWKALCRSLSCAATMPSERFDHAMAYDSARAKVVLFGGTSCATTSCADLGDTWEWDGAAWQSKASGPPRAGHAMDYDAKLALTVLFGGTHGQPLSDTWTWNGTAWAQIVTPSAPARRSSSTFTYDSARHHGLLFGGSGASTEAWDWSGTSWQPLANASANASAGPAARSAHATAYDEKRRRVVLYGGFGNGAYLNDTWEAHRYGGSCAAGAECDTSVCTDGVCCASPCGTCESCNGASPGLCTPVVDAEDLDSCAGGHFCDKSGLCLLSPGVACRARADCASGFCVDGVCCDSSCDGLCRACVSKLTGAADGKCANVTQGLDPHDQCPDDGACTCQRDGVCDGAGACELYSPKQDCSKCGDQTEADFRCDGLGACLSPLHVRCVDDHVLSFLDGHTADCSPYTCTPDGTCRERCESSEDCFGGTTCNAAKACAAAPPPPRPADEPGSCNVCNAHASASDRDGAWITWGALFALFAGGRVRRRRALLARVNASKTSR